MVKQRDQELAAMKQKRSQRGLMTAQLGSIYDVPTQHTESQDTAPSMMASTMGGGSVAQGSKVTFSDINSAFGQTEGATFRPAYKTFFTPSQNEDNAP